MSMHSTLHPSPQSIGYHGELDHKESSIPDFAVQSISFLGPSDSWRYKSDKSNFPDKKSFTDYAIVHRTQRSQRSSEQTMPSVRFDPNEIENNIVTIQRPIHVQRPDFSFAKQRSNNFSDKAAVESVDKTIDAYGINTKEFTREQNSQINVEEDKSLEMYMNQMLDVSQKVEEEVADKTIETYFSNTMDVSEKIKLETANLKAKYLASLDAEFKPSRLFSITEKLSTVMRTMKTLKQEETQKVNPEVEISQDQIQENKEKEEHKPKRTTVNLMDLIIEYTKNPNLEQKIKMTKRSFLNKKNNNNKENIDKENQPEDASMTLETSQGVRAQNTQNSYPARQSRKEKEKNFIQLNKCVKDTMTLSSSTKKYGSQDRARSVSKEQQKTRSTSRTPGKLSNSQIRRSKSGERYNNRLNQSAIEGPTLMTSQLRSTSCQRRGSLAASGANSTAFLSELGINCTMFRKDEESVIMTLKDTMQKLLDKTEANREQIRKLKLSQGDNVTSLEVNKAKVNYYKQKTVIRVGKRVFNGFLGNA